MHQLPMYLFLPVRRPCKVLRSCPGHGWASNCKLVSVALAQLGIIPVNQNISPAWKSWNNKTSPCYCLHKLWRNLSQGPSPKRMNPIWNPLKSYPTNDGDLTNTLWKSQPWDEEPLATRHDVWQSPRLVTACTDSAEKAWTKWLERKSKSTTTCRHSIRLFFSLRYPSSVVLRSGKSNAAKLCINEGNIRNTYR